jgi:type IV secretion system protein VirB9
MINTQKKTFGLLIIFLFNISLFAVVDPRASTYDNRIGFVTYNPNDVFKIKAKNGFVTILEFDKNENIIDGSTGFNDGWEITQSGNIVHIRPKPYISEFAEDEDGNAIKKKSVISPNQKDWKTNLFIRTDKRLYVADLTLSKNRTQYKISFKYPKQRRQESIARHNKRKAAKAQENIIRDLNRVTVPRNWNYLMKVNKNSETITPSFAYDDGTFTYIGFDTTKIFPTAFLREGEEESILNTHIKKIGNYDVLVIHKTAKIILLRSGNKLVGILNNGYGKNPNYQSKNTNNSNVKRKIINGK